VAEVGSESLILNFRSVTSPEILLLLSSTIISISREVAVVGGGIVVEPVFVFNNAAVEEFVIRVGGTDELD